MFSYRFPRGLACALLLAGSGVLAPMVAVQAQTRVELGYVYIDGRNEAHGDSDLTTGHLDWRPVDQGNGVALSFRHDWESLYTKARIQRATLGNRAVYWPPLAAYGSWWAPPLRRDWRFHNAFDERYRSYELSVGWRHRMGASTGLWVELGALRETWSSSGGVWTLVLGPEDDYARVPMDLAASASAHTTWMAAVGGDLSLGPATTLSVAVDYRRRSYFPSTAVNNIPGVRGSSLLEGVLRLRQGLVGPWEGFIEYRPSEQRQYWQAGIGYRF